LGHSMGGAIALELAINHPGRLRRLVLGSTTARLSARNEQLFDAWVELIRQGCDAEAVTREIFLWMYPPWMYEDPVFLDTLVRECMEYPYFQPFDGLVGQVEALRGFDVRDRLGDIQAPVLVLHGEQDQLIPPDEGVSLGRAIPGSRVEILDGAGHLPHRQLRESFARLAGDFLEE
ncbi:MAG: alpha/beta fold hydrolase, partial [Desulfovibrionaceae bacterium]